MLALISQAGPEEPPRRIVDVGCGTVRLLRAVSERWPEAVLLGVDPAEHMIAQAARLNPSITFKVAVAESLPFPDQNADLILSSVSFHHWGDKEQGLREVARVLVPGGWLCLADHTFPSFQGGKSMSRRGLWVLISRVGLDVRQHSRARFILITLAQKREATTT